MTFVVLRRSASILTRLALSYPSTGRPSFSSSSRLRNAAYGKSRLLGGAALAGGVTCAIYASFHHINAEEKVGGAAAEPLPVTSLRGRPFSPENERATSETKGKEGGLPDYAPYLLIGAGTASFAAFRAIKARDPTAKVLIVGEEERLPHMRPPLSKEMWYPPARNQEEKVKAMMTESKDDDGSLTFKSWSGRERSLYFEPEEFYTPLEELKEKVNGGLSVLKGVRVERIEPEKQTAHLSDGRKIAYGKCLIATGGKPKPLAAFHDASLEGKVSSFRSVEDFFRLRNLTKQVKEVVVVGGGFLGSELACALAARKDVFGFNVTQIYPERGNLARVLPKYLSGWTTEKVREEGVNVMSGTLVDSAELDRKSSKVVLSLSNGKDVKADHVVVAAGIEPDRELAERSGLEVDDRLGGYTVNAELQARSNVWVAGDAACFHDSLLGRRRIEHHDHAVVSGRLAGANMAGESKPYSHQSMFWSDLGPEIGFEGVGLVDSQLPTVGVFAAAASASTTTGSEPSALHLKEKPILHEADVPSPATKPSDDKYDRGVVFYLKDEVVVGVLMWNVFNKLPVARRVLREHRRFEDLTEVAKLFDIHGTDEPE